MEEYDNTVEIELNKGNKTVLYYKWDIKSTPGDHVLSMFINGLMGLGFTTEEIKDYLDG